MWEISTHGTLANLLCDLLSCESRKRVRIRVSLKLQCKRRTEQFKHSWTTRTSYTKTLRNNLKSGAVTKVKVTTMLDWTKGRKFFTLTPVHVPDKTVFWGGKFLPVLTLSTSCFAANSHKLLNDWLSTALLDPPQQPQNSSQRGSIGGPVGNRGFWVG